MSRAPHILLTTVIALGAGCTRPTGGLPDLAGEQLCTSDFVPPTFCEWAGRLDALAVGDVASISWETTPADGRDAASCGFVAPALVITLKEARPLWEREGATAVPSDVAVFVGPDARSFWRPEPILDHATQATVWAPNDTNALVVGQQIGFALHFDAALGRFTASVEPLFRPGTADGEGVAFSDTKKLCDNPPTHAPDFALPNLEALSNAANACRVPPRSEPEVVYPPFSGAQCIAADTASSAPTE